MPFARRLSLLLASLLLLSGAACQRTPEPAPGPSLGCIWVMEAQPGDPSVAVEGLVLSGDGKPLPGVAIQVMRRDGAGVSFDTLSAPDGRFSLSVPTESAPVCLHARAGSSIHVECDDLPTSRPATLHALLVLKDSTVPPVTILTDSRAPELLPPAARP